MPQAGADTVSITAPGRPAVVGAGSDPAGSFRFPDPGESIREYEPPEAPAPVFGDHALAAGRLQPEQREPGNPDWFLLILLLAVVYLTALRVLYGRVIRSLFGAFFNITATNQAVRDENLLMQRTSVLLSVLFYFTGGLFLYQLSEYWHWEIRGMGAGFQRFFLFAVFLAVAYSVKLVFLKLLGFVFRAEKPVSYYIFNIFLVNNVLGIALLPLIACIAFAPPAWSPFFLHAAATLAGACYLFRLFRGIRSWHAMPRHSLFYLILYLCAFEFAPLFVIVKLV